MLATNSLSTINREAAPAAAKAASAAELGSEQFLTLMLAQIRNQDPLKPLEPGEFLGQLAQFSTVTGVQDVNRSVSELAGSLRSSQLSEGASLVGRNVLAAGSEIRLGATDTVRGGVGVPEGATQLEVSIRDAAGALVRRIDVPVRDDFAEFQWDGITQLGQRAEPGAYRIETVASIGGRSESVETLLQRRVQSVSVDAQGSGIRLNTASGSVALGDVRRIM